MKTAFFSFRYIATFCLSLSIALTSGLSLAADGQIVIEDLTPSQLRSQIKRIETEIYRVFNASTEDKKLHINCYDYVPIGSNIGEEACEPQFLVDARGENANNARFDTDVLLSPQDLQRRLAAEYEALTAAMTKLAQESRYFSELNNILAALRDELKNQ